jgi:hypothetical protein
MCGGGVAGARWREREVKRREEGHMHDLKEEERDEARQPMSHIHNPQMPLFLPPFPYNLHMHNTCMLVSLYP